jgi:preprotein translocase subunit SecB
MANRSFISILTNIFSTIKRKKQHFTKYSQSRLPRGFSGFSMTRINYDMVRLRLQKTVFLHNPSYQQPVKGEVIALGLSLRNGGEFFQDDTMANFLQSIKTQASPDVPFSLEVEFAAVFAMTISVPQSEQNTFIHQIFPQMVFPHTREYVAETTRRGGYPPLILNLGLFQDNQSNGSEDTIFSLNGPKWIH